jgi:MFS family permease
MVSERLPRALSERDFRRFVVAVALSQIGTQGTLAAVLYHVYQLSGSLTQVGLVGAGRAIAILLLTPLGGHFADRYDRRLVLQVSQGVSLIASTVLAVTTLLGVVGVGTIIAMAALNSAAATFENPSRKAIVPALVPPRDTVQAFAITNVSFDIGTLVGPALAGLLIALGGPGLVYLGDALTYVSLIILLRTIRLTRPAGIRSEASKGVLQGMRDGLIHLRARPIILHLMSLDVAAMLFSSYRVVLPAIAIDRLGIGPEGYGFLASAPSLGAMIGAVVAYRMASGGAPAGATVLVMTAVYGIAVAVVGVAGSSGTILIAVALVGLTDSVAKTIRHATVMLETPDHMRGRVGAIYGLTGGGIPPVGDFNVGWLSAAIGVGGALAVGGAIPIVYALVITLFVPTVRRYRVNDGT